MQKSNSIVVLIDGNWLINRAYSVFNKRKDVVKATCDAVINWSCEYAILLKATHICICFDGNKVFRYGIYDGYKSNRRKRKDDLKGDVADLNHLVDDTNSDNSRADVYDCLEPLFNALNALGIPWHQDVTLEADDLMASAAAYLKAYVKQIYLVTLDKDINQCIDKNVDKYVPGVSGKVPTLLGLKDLEKKYPYVTGSRLIDYQTLIGDSTDNIPKLMSAKKAASIVKKYESVKDFFVEEKEGQDFWTKHKEEVMLNRRLVRLLPDGWEPDIEKLQIRHAKHVVGAPKQWNELMGSLRLKSAYKSLF